MGASQKPSPQWKKPVPTKDELKELLTPEQFHVTQENGTEPPFRNAFWDHWEPGIYVDVISGEPLFSSEEKFDAKCGWPSFSKPISGCKLIKKIDRSLEEERLEVRSSIANSHLGHVFDDAPAPLITRYCINSVALRFVPYEDLEKEGYQEFKKLFSVTKATFGGIHFWALEDAFRRIKGVLGTKSGFCKQLEAVQVEFDPRILPYSELIRTFCKFHHPEVDGTSEPTLFFHTQDQRRSAFKVKDDLKKGFIIEAAQTFTEAEDKDQRFLERRGVGHLKK